MRKLYLTMAAALVSAASFAQAPALEGTRVPGALRNLTETQAKAKAGNSLLKTMKNGFFNWGQTTLGRRAPLSTDMITEQPEGTLHKDLYSDAHGYLVFWGYVLDNYSSGYANDVVEADDGAVYIYNPYSTISTGTWVKGYKTEGDTVAVDLPQPMFSQDNDEGGKDYFYAFKMVLDSVEQDGEKVLTYVPDSTTQTMKFVWRNDSLVKVGDDLFGLATKDGGWVGYGDDSIVMHKVTEVPTAAPANADKAADYALSYYDLSTGSPDTKIVKAVLDDKGIYVKGLLSDSPDVWIKGDLSADGKATFKKQYLGVVAPQQARYHTWFQPAAVDSVYDDFFGSYSYTPKELADGLTLTLDPATGSFKSGKDSAIVTSMGENIATTVEFFKEPEIAPYKEVAATPQKATLFAFLPYDERYGYGAMQVTLPKKGTNDEILDVSKLYYNVYFDDELFTFSPDEYTKIPEEMTDVPYNYADGFDFLVSGETHTIYFYTTGFDKFGIELFYKGGGETKSSGIAWFDTAAAGISNAATAAGRSVSTVYHDLSGREVKNPAKGIYVKTVKFADGTVKAFKVVK